MRKLVLFFCILICSTVSGKENVTVKMTLDDFVRGVEQDVYVYRIVGNNYYIDDSVHIVPSKNTYIVHSRVDYESPIRILFSKRGPLHMLLLAHPNEKIEVNITEDDHHFGMLYKKASKGSVSNDSLVSFWDKSFEYNRRISEVKKDMTYRPNHADSILLSEKIKQIEAAKLCYIKHTAMNSDYPYIAHMAQMLVKKQVSPKDYDAISQRNESHFPIYLATMRQSEKYIDPKQDYVSNRKFIKAKESDRVKLKSLPVAKSAVDSIGQIVSVILRDSLGKGISVSNYLGKYVLIEVWASWCAPCIAGMPTIKAVQEAYPDDLVCCLVTIDKDPKLWKRAIKKYQLGSMLHYKATDEKGDVYGDNIPLVGNAEIPRNLLLDREGRLVAINLFDAELWTELSTLIKH